MRQIETPEAPAAIGPYSQATVVGNLLFTAGQIPLIPGRADLAGDTIEIQTEQVLRNLDAILRAAGCSWESVAKTTVFLTNLGEFQAFNAVYERVLGSARPARSTVQVAALPKGARVEIELVASLPGK